MKIWARLPYQHTTNEVRLWRVLPKPIVENAAENLFDDMIGQGSIEEGEVEERHEVEPIQRQLQVHLVLSTQYSSNSMP